MVKGTFNIQFDKNSYSPGDQVNGFIFLNLYDVKKTNTIYMVVNGVEESKLVESKWMTHDEYNSRYRYHGKNTEYWGYSRYGNKIHSRYDYWHSISHSDIRPATEGRAEERLVHLDHYQYKPIFNHMFPLYVFPQAYIPPGQYQFPFSFILPQGMPATFNYEWTESSRNCYADISYSVTASMDSTGWFSSPIKATEYFLVNQGIKGDGSIRQCHIEKPITNWCCIDKGKVNIKAYFERSDYESGQTAVIIAEIDNTNCKENIDHINGVFRQTLNIQAGSFNKTISNVLTKVTVNGMAPGSQNIGENAKRFNVALTNTDGGYVQPTCSGTLIKNRYSLETSAKMSGCQCCSEAPTASIETNIFNRPIERTIWTPPSNWQPQIMSAYTCDFSSQFAFSGGMTSNLAPATPNINITIGDGGFGQPPMGQQPNPGFGQQGNPGFGQQGNPGFGQQPQVSMNINMNADQGFG